MNFIKTDNGYVNLDLVTMIVAAGSGRCRLLGGDQGCEDIDDANLDVVLKALGVTVADAGEPKGRP